MSSEQVKWTVFIALSFAVPLPFYGGVIGGIGSLFIVVQIFLAFLFSTIVTWSYPILPLILAVNVAIWRAILFAVSKLGAAIVSRFSIRARAGVVAGVVVALLSLGLLPVYAWGPDNLFWGSPYETYASVTRNLWRIG